MSEISRLTRAERLIDKLCLAILRMESTTDEVADMIGDVMMELEEVEFGADYAPTRVFTDEPLDAHD